MRANLLLHNPNDVRQGYLNIDPFAPESDESRVRGDVSNLNHSVEANEAEEVVAKEILEYFPAARVDEILDNWLSKLSHGGTLTVGFLDVREVSRGVLDGRLSITDAQLLLYGEQREPWQMKKSAFCLSQVADALEGRGYKILQKRVVNFRGYVTCQRP